MNHDCIARCLTVGAIYAVYGLTFALAGGFKFRDKVVPDWFKAQFGNTFVAKIPGLTIAYWKIAFLEILVPCLLIVSLVRTEFLPGSNPCFLQLAVALASVIFTMLGFGLRLVNDFQGAANSFFYFTGTLITQMYISHFMK